MPIERFLGKVILMTGATQGIGLEAARRVGLEGGKLVISSRQDTNVKQAVTELRKEGIDVHGMTCHQGEREDRRKLLDFTVRKYGGIDAVFMSAGVSPHHGNILTVTEDLFDKTFDVNVKENFLFIQELVPFLEKRGGGSIVTNSTAVACDYGIGTLGKNIQLMQYLSSPSGYVYQYLG
ncbi:hypothetical protein BSL78_08397 [Apostichopus japonicus]|uniref:Dehydrogenase/reductase SDR family member 4 n=1 Tax=Stichopus japonicus TaxID=307972 RepID=A0A2G8L381_STIJA|nr:hypothetical protein BSL78_08397 [Apostichopus japonicus]